MKTIRLFPRFLRLSISSKLMLLGLMCIVMITLGLVTTAIWQGRTFSNQAKAQTKKIINADLDHITQSVYNLVRAQNESIQQKVNHDLNVARYVLNNSGPTSLSNESVTWSAVNQYTKKQHKIELPKMMVGSQWLGQNDQMWADSPVVDRIKRLVGGTATIFQRMNEQGDILRVSTNVERLDGNRAIGTYIPAVNPDGTQNPVVSTVMQGKTYRGIAYVVNAWYITAYEPLRSQQGEIIGVLYVGVKQENIGALRQAIMQVQIGQTGYAFVVGGKGDHRGHYIISEKGLRDGEDLWDLTDMQGNYFIRNAIAKAMECKSGATTTLHYPWKMAGETSPRWKIGSLTYYEPWDWVIGSSVYEDEVMGPTVAIDQGYRAMIRMFCLVALLIAVVGGWITLFFARKMSGTLHVITGAATTLTDRDLPRLMGAIDAVNGGDYSVAFQLDKTPVLVDTRDELGTMADAFTSMNMALVRVGEAFSMMVASLRQSTEQLEQQVESRTLALHESERRLADIINFLPDATLVVDADSRVIAWNRAMEKMSGVKSEAMLGKGNYEYAKPFYGRRQPILIDQVLHPDAEYEKSATYFKREENILCAEVQPSHLEDGEKYVFCTASALHNANGEKVGAIETLRDITPLKQTMNELIEARRSAEAATEAKSEFLANMSHEIRTPLNAVLGLSSLCLRTKLSEKQYDYLSKIETSSQNLLGIINDILDFSKIEAGKLEMESADFDLFETMDNLTNMFSAKSAENGIELVVSMSPEVPRFLAGDALRLGQVLINLTSNAVKFTDSGEVVVKVALLEKKNNRVKLNFSVRDTGIGIRADKLPDLFMAFTQADGSTTRQYGGTGLGLAICKRIVEMMGGDIWAESDEGQGSCFQFTAVLDCQLASPAQPDVIPQDLYNLKTLVVDDNEAARIIVKEILESFRFDVSTANSGEDALHILTRDPTGKSYELILMDWNMPGMNGIETIIKIRREKQFGHIPIILMTAFGREEIIIKAKKAGANAFLIKPLKQSILFDTIMDVLGREQAASQPNERRVGRDPRGDRHFDGANVLLVEDNPINQQVAAEILENAGMVVLVANNGEEALSMFKQSVFDIILMDVQMPVMDGYAATRAIRGVEAEALPKAKETSRPPETPIVAMTAHAMKGDREKCIDAGMNDYVTKPIDVENLFAVLGNWILEDESPRETAGREPEIRTPVPGEDLPEKLPGIDVESALKRLGGNRSLFRKLLVEFKKEYTGVANDIREALRSGVKEVAQRRAHTIKGVAGNFSATDLMIAASDLENGIRDENLDNVEPLVDRFERAMDEILSAVALLTDPADQPVASDRPPINPSRLAQRFGELARFLESQDLDAEDCLESIKQDLSGSDCQANLDDLENRISHLDFENARTVLNHLAKQMGIALEID